MPGRCVIKHHGRSQRLLLWRVCQLAADQDWEPLETRASLNACEGTGAACPCHLLDAAAGMVHGEAQLVKGTPQPYDMMEHVYPRSATDSC